VAETDLLNFLVKTELTELEKRPTLYHYTSAAGLLGIINSATLRGSNYLYLNDTTEVEYGKAIALQVLKGEAKRRSPPERSLVEGVIDELSFGPENPEYADPILRRARTLEVYLTSLCERPDLLSQWRGYGDSKGRYCVGLEVREMVGAGLFFPARVVYELDEQRSLLHSVVEEFFSAPVTAEERAANRVILTFAIQRALCRLKHPGFAEEREWRLMVNLADHDDQALLQFDAATGAIKPFIDILRGSKSDPERLPIREIYVGASRHPARSRHAVEQLIRKAGYHHCEVRMSDIPLDE
jgi:hypothetical protein